MKCNYPKESLGCSFHYNGLCMRDHNYECPALVKPTLTTAGEPIAFFGPIGIEPMWHPYPEEKPKEFGKYLVVQNSSLGVYYAIVFWGKSKWVEDAQKEYKKRAAYWYQYDSEWGDYICDNVVAWMPIPKYEKEKTDD